MGIARKKIPLGKHILANLLGCALFFLIAWVINLQPCEEGLFIGGCDLGDLLMYVFASTSAVSFVILSSILRLKLPRRKYHWLSIYGIAFILGILSTFFLFFILLPGVFFFFNLALNLIPNLS